MVLLVYALSMNTSPIGLAITGAFGGEEKPCCFWDIFTKRQKEFEKMVEQASRCLKNTCYWKAIEALSAIVGSVGSAILNFLGKAVGFAAEHTWALTVFVPGLFWIWVIQKIKNQKN